MNILLLLYLSSLVALLNSTTCSRKTKPKKEGFIRTQCFPGFYEGSCLIIIKEKLNLHDAIETCQYDYGGRLATAPKNEAYKVWAQTVYFNHFDADENARYWIGYSQAFNYEEPNEVMEKYINRTVWDRVFQLSDSDDSVVQWESDANRELFNFDNVYCSNYGTVFNPTNLKFNVKKYEEEHYALCETPRWAKLQCNTGWHLIPQIRMCVKVHEECVDFFTAFSTCREDASHITVAQDENELEMQRDVINQYDLEDKCQKHKKGKGGFWTGIRSLQYKSFSIDGTNSTFSVEASSRNENKCQTHYYSNDGVHTGVSLGCRSISVPSMCQRFADQSLQVNVA